MVNQRELKDINFGELQEVAKRHGIDFNQVYSIVKQLSKFLDEDN